MPPEKEREDEGPQEILAVGPLQTVAPRSFIPIGLFLLIHRFSPSFRKSMSSWITLGARSRRPLHARLREEESWKA